MSVLSFLKVWFISYIIFFAADMLTHMVLLGPIFASELGGITKAINPQTMPIVLLQTVIISMATVFLVWKTAASNRSIVQTATVGAVVGLLIYGIHELSNFATIPGWSLTITILHTIVGVVQMGVMAVVVEWVMKRFGTKQSVV